MFGVRILHCSKECGVRILHCSKECGVRILHCSKECGVRILHCSKECGVRILHCSKECGVRILHCSKECGVRILHCSKECWKIIKIHQYYTMALSLLQRTKQWGWSPLSREQLPPQVEYNWGHLSWEFRRHYLETDPDPIAIMVIRVELFTHKPSETNTNWHCMVTHARLCYRWLLSIGLVDK